MTGCIVIADAVAFIVIIVADIPFPEWIYPFIFYIQASYIVKDSNCTLIILLAQAVPAVAIFFPESFLTGGKFVSAYLNCFAN